jgi:hypothetical protein
MKISHVFQKQEWSDKTQRADAISLLTFLKEGQEINNAGSE